MKQLDPKVVWLFFINSLLKWFFLLIFLGLFFVDPFITGVNNFSFNSLWWFVVILILLVFAWLFVWAKLTYHFYRYELTDNGFRRESGVIRKKYVTIPYDRIQNVDIYRGILARILGLSDLRVQTAGASAQVSYHRSWGMGAEGRLIGLSKEVAEQLRDELIQRAKKSTNQGL